MIKIFLLFIIFCAGFFYIVFVNKKESFPQLQYKQRKDLETSKFLKLYQNKKLGFTISIPSDSKITENITHVDILLDKNKINISRIATNFDNIDDYLKDFDSKRTIGIEDQQLFKIGNFDAVNRTEKFSGGPSNQQRGTYIFVYGWVYSFSTSSEKLFEDLDKIARTFRYTP